MNSTAVPSVNISSETIPLVVANVTDVVLPVVSLIASQWSHWFIFGTAIFGLFWGAVQIMQVSSKFDHANYFVAF